MPFRGDMRHTAILLMCVPGFALAQDPTIEADRVLGVFGVSEYADNILNNDDYVDLSVLAISENRQSVDLYFAVSDPETGQLEISEIARDILPYHPEWQGDVKYLIWPENSSYLPTVFVESVSSPNKFNFTTFPHEKGSVISYAQVFQSNPQSSGRPYSCRLNYFPESFDLPEMSSLLDQHSSTRQTGPDSPPFMIEWSYGDFVQNCPDAPPVFPPLPSNPSSESHRPGPEIDITRVLSVNSTTDWNDDGLPDRLMLVLSDTGQSADLLTFISDGANGSLNYWGTTPSALPIEWPFRRDEGTIFSIMYSQGDNSINYPLISSRTDDITISAELVWRETGWEVVKAGYSDYNQQLHCLFDYNTGISKIGQPETDIYGIEIGTPPALAPNWWEGLSAEGCVIRG